MIRPKTEINGCTILYLYQKPLINPVKQCEKHLKSVASAAGDYVLALNILYSTKNIHTNQRHILTYFFPKLMHCSFFDVLLLTKLIKVVSWGGLYWISFIIIIYLLNALNLTVNCLALYLHRYDSVVDVCGHRVKKTGLNSWISTLPSSETFREQL